MRGRALDGESPRAGTIWIAEDVTKRRQVDLALASARDAAEADTGPSLDAQAQRRLFLRNRLVPIPMHNAPGSTRQARG